MFLDSSIDLLSQSLEWRIFSAQSEGAQHPVAAEPDSWGLGQTTGLLGTRPGLVQWAPSFQRSAFQISNDCLTQQFHFLELILRK